MSFKWRFLRRPGRVMAWGVLAGAMSGCVTESDRREATRLRRPEMPAMAGVPGGLPSAPEEAEVNAVVRRAVASGRLVEARRELDTLPDRAAQERVARGAAALLAERDPAVALAWARALPPGLAQRSAAGEAGRVRAEREPEAALAWAAELAEPDLTTPVRQAVAESVAARGAPAALARLHGLPAGAGREEMLGLVAAAWARRDPEAAERWVRQTVPEAERPGYAARVGFEVAQSDPRRAVAMVELLPAGRDRWLLTSAITQTWVAVDAPAAFAWTRQQPAGEAREAAVAGLDAGLGVAVTRRVTAAPNTRSGTGRAAGGGLTADPTAATGPSFAAWLALQSAERSTPDAWAEYVRQQAAGQPQIVGQWLETLPGGPARDRAQEAYWETLLGAAPAEAARWLETQPRSERTPERVERTAREWRRRDPQAAAHWLRGQSLPPDRIEWLLREAGPE